MPKTKVFRVRNIPNQMDTKKLEALIREMCEEQGAAPPKRIRLRLAPSCFDPNMQTATLEFSEDPPFLVQGRSFFHEWNDDGDQIRIDQDFYGLTQLYPTEPGKKILADIVAITGLDGHGYGSWRGRESRKMWLQHFFSVSFPNCRTMIYGYDSKLQSHGVEQIDDYSDGFLAELAKARSAINRPIIFIAHSFGGIIASQSLVEANLARDPVKHAIYENTQAVMFFATPHRGMITEDIMSMMDSASAPQSRKELVASIDQKSDGLKQKLEQFRQHVSFKIVSFLEMQASRKLVRKQDGTYSRNGDYITTLGKDSALLDLPRSMEERIPVHGADHSNIVKFNDPGDSAYETVVLHIKGYLAVLNEGVKPARTSAYSLLSEGNDSQDGTRLLEAASKGDVMAMKGLLDRGMDIETANSLGETALHKAAFKGHSKAVWFLLQNGADKNRKSRAGITPGAMAESSGHRMVVNMIRFGYNPS